MSEPSIVTVLSHPHTPIIATEIGGWLGGAEQSWILILYEEALLLASNLVRVTEEATYTPHVGNMVGNSLGFHSSQIPEWAT